MPAGQAPPLDRKPYIAEARAPAEEVPWDWIDRGWDDRRQHVRKSVVLPAKLATAEGEFDCLVLDISAGGARLHIIEELDTSAAVALILDGPGRFAAKVAWRATAEIGLRFAVDPDEAARRLANIL